MRALGFWASFQVRMMGGTSYPYLLSQLLPAILPAGNIAAVQGYV